MESETMSGIVEKQVKYDPLKMADIEFEILDFSTTKEHTQVVNFSQSDDYKEREHLSTGVQIVVYESPHCSPRIINIKHNSHYGDFINEISIKTHQLCQQFETVFPYPIIRSLIENFIHTDFAEPVVSILEEGKVLRLSDQGCGIKNKEDALLVGFSAVKIQHKPYIAGVGSGLPNVLHYAHMLGGTLTIKDNLDRGTVVTLSLLPEDGPTPPSENGYISQPHFKSAEINYKDFEPPTIMSLTERQQEVLIAVKDCGFIGPSQIAELLDISAATAYRDLQYLEHQSYVYTKSGKRAITEKGVLYLEKFIFHSQY